VEARSAEKSKSMDLGIVLADDREDCDGTPTIETGKIAISCSHLRQENRVCRKRRTARDDTAHAGTKGSIGTIDVSV
jgi:hypothetical protein